MRLSPQANRRRGAVAVLLALLLIPLLAMVAFAVDTAWIVLTEADLQNAADSAALAGSDQLMQGYVQYYLPGQTTQTTILNNTMANARTYAKNYASYNAAGGVSSLVLNDSDITFGYTDSQGNYTPIAQYSGFPNTIKVTIRRDSQANGPLGLFFGPVLGTPTQNLQATAAATIYTGTINTFKSGSSTNYGILPMTYDINHWNNFLKTGKGPDGTTDTSANGAPQLQVYPSIKYDGNFGLLSLDQGNDGASTISGWIDNGVPASDMQKEFDANLLPLSSHDPTKWDWKGNPGLKTSDIHALENDIGKSYLLPLFKPLNDGSTDPTQYAAGTGQGSNYSYNIVQFVAVTITYVDNSGVHVQPTAILDPNAVFSSTTPAGPPTSSLPLVTTFTTAKLTQ
jgi:Flp pilus assembly protein TadG